MGGVYTFSMVFNQLHFITYMPWKLIIGFAMTYVCIREEHWKLIIKAYLVFIMSGMLLAGVFMFLQLNGSNEYFSVKYLIFALMLIYIFTYRIVVFIKSRIHMGELIYDVDIAVQGNIFKIKGFWDTGNEIFEPATMLPVIVVEEKIFKEINMNKLNLYKIPYKPFNGENNYLTGFKPEYIALHVGNELLKKQAIVALCSMKLNNMNDYNALLSREII